MKVSVTVSVDIDPVAWADTFGCLRADVREDVREYVREVVANMQVLDEVTPRKS
jgi:hypothetical protein